MIYGDLQFFDILIFAAIAGFIIYRLRSVLGKEQDFKKIYHSQNLKKPKNKRMFKKYLL